MQMLNSLINTIVLEIEDIIPQDHILEVSSNTIAVDLKQMFKPETITENAVDLNINLMKWRMAT